MEGDRMLTVNVELDTRMLGGSAMRIPLEDAWLGLHTCRELRERVLNNNLDRLDVLGMLERVKLFCIKQ
jgi:hypothetical protein